MILPYETVFSRYRGLVNDPIELSLEPGDLVEIYVERLKNVVGDPRVVAKFSELALYDETMQIEFTLKNSVSDLADYEFVTKLFSLGMAINWLEPKVDSLNNVVLTLGGKEQKTLQNSYQASKARLSDLESQFSRLLAYHGYINNSYIRS